MKTKESNDDQALLSPQEAAEFLGVPLLTLRTWRSRRIGPQFYRVGKHVRYRRAEIVAWIEKNAGISAA